MSIIDQLKAQNGFTDTEVRIAEFMLVHDEEIADIGIQQLAKKAYCSHSAVVRLVKKLGYAGYKEFKVAWVKEYQNRLYFVNDINPNFPFRRQDNQYDIAKKIADLCIDSIRRTVDRLTLEMLEEITEILVDADRIFLFATGDSQIRARSFQNKFNKFNKYLIMADEYGESQWNALSLTPNDIALFISYSGKSTDYEKYLAIFNQRLIKSVVLTSSRYSNMGQLATHVIEVPEGEDDVVKVATFASQISFEYVLDILFSTVYASDYNKNKINISAKEKFIHKHF